MKKRIIRYIDSSLINEQTDEIAEPCKITAIGWVVKETDEYITLARECIDDEFRGQVAIPKKAII